MLWVEAEAALLEAAAVPSVDALLALDDAALVAALWRLSDGGAPLPLPSSHPTFIIYTSGTSGYRPRGLVGDTAGYCSGLARTMRLAFDVRNRRPGRKAGVARGCWLCARAWAWHCVSPLGRSPLAPHALCPVAHAARTARPHSPRRAIAALPMQCRPGR